MTINHTTLAAALRTILEANATPSFVDVFIGEPVALPIGGPYAAAWYIPRAVDAMTFGNVMVTERWQVACWWPVQVERETLETLEIQVADCDQALRTAFRADSQLGGSVSDLSIVDPQVGFDRFPLLNSGGKTAHYRAMGFVLELDDLEGEAIAP